MVSQLRKLQYCSYRAGKKCNTNLANEASLFHVNWILLVPYYLHLVEQEDAALATSCVTDNKGNIGTTNCHAILQNCWRLFRNHTLLTADHWVNLAIDGGLTDRFRSICHSNYFHWRLQGIRNNICLSRLHYILELTRECLPFMKHFIYELTTKCLWLSCFKVWQSTEQLFTHQRRFTGT